MPSARAAFFMASNEFMFSDGRTKLSWPDWKAKAEEVKRALKKGSKWQKKTVQLYGQPYWEVDKNGKPIKTGLAVKDPSKGAAFYIKPGTGGVLGRTLLSTRRTNQLKSSKTRRNRQKETGTDFDKWVGRLDEKGWPKGKSLTGFIAAEKAGETELYKEIERLKALGLDVTDGHIVSLANENIKASPLERKGQGGSHSFRSRVPEIGGDNYNKGPRQDVPKHRLRQAGIATTPAESLQLYLTGDEGTGVNLTTPDKQRIGIQGEDPNLVIAQRKAAIEKAKQNGDNGYNGKVNGKKNGKLNGSVLGAAGKTRKVDAIANIGMNAATGNYAGVAVGGGALAMTAALQNKQTQQAIGKQIGKLVKKRTAQTMMKAVPGFDIFLSGQEALGRLQAGQLGQAGIAALSGAIGWVPLIGDGVSASLDLSNTAIDISRLQIPKGTSKKKGIIRPKSATRRLKFGI